MSLDPKTNRTQREAEETKKNAENHALESAFPYGRQSFDPFYFGLEMEPVKDAKDPSDS